MTHTGKYSYVTPATRSPRLSRWATLAFTPPLVVGLSISLGAVFMSGEHLLRAIFSVLPAQLFIFPVAFAYCLLPSTLLWWLLRKRPHPRSHCSKTLHVCHLGFGLGLLVAPPTFEQYSRSR
ncbi:MAG: hypothetical protein QM760_04895 [Nibricoccus sp.]